MIWLLTILDSDEPEGDHSSPPDIPDIDTSRRWASIDCITTAGLIESVCKSAPWIKTGPFLRRLVPSPDIASPDNGETELIPISCRSMLSTMENPTLSPLDVQFTQLTFLPELIKSFERINENPALSEFIVAIAPFPEVRASSIQTLDESMIRTPES